MSREAVKFLELLPPKDQLKIRSKIKELVYSIETKGIIPFRELDIKGLEGEWKGHLRMRVGKVRMIFSINKSASEHVIFAIDFRGNIYK